MGRKKKPILPRKAQTTEHETSDEVYIPLHEEFGFTLDAAASSKNKKCKKYFSKQKNGLKQSWEGHTVWINPPYDVKSISAFVDKALMEVVEHGIVVVMLLPSKTDQKWFHKLWEIHDSGCYEDISVDVDFRWVEGRIRFKNNKHSAAFASVVVVIN